MSSEHSLPPYTVPVLSLDDARVMVIDDQLPNVLLVRQILKIAGFTRVRGFTNPREALSAMAGWPPDLVILDLHMPLLDGVGLIEAMRPRERTYDFVPVLVLTADTTRAALTRVLQAGANDFLTKPVDQDELTLRVRNLLSIRVAHEELKHRNAALALELRSVITDGPQRQEARLRQREQIRWLIDEGGPSMALQPIVDLTNGTVLGHEALARFNTPTLRPPNVWFEMASAVGLGAELELTSMLTALTQVSRLPEGQVLAINVSPATLINDRVLDVLTGYDLSRIVFEITEHHPVDDYDTLNASLQRLRDVGARVSIDDAGAGYASLQHILKLSPNIIKLDISLTRDVESDPVRRALASSLVRFAEEVGAVLIAEGIETSHELATLRKLGVGYGQGMHLGVPGPDPIERSIRVLPVAVDITTESSGFAPTG